MVYGIYLVRLNHLDGESFIKVGLTIDSVKKRFSHLANYKYKIISFIKTYYRDAWDAEDDLKTYFKIKGLKHWPKHPLAKSGRPFGRTECAKDSSKLVEYVKTRLSMLENLNNV